MKWTWEQDYLGVPGTPHKVRIERWWFLRRVTLLLGTQSLVSFYTMSEREAARLARSILSGGRA